MKNKKLLYALAGVVGCAVLVVVFVFAKNGGNLTGSLINVSPVARTNQPVVKLDDSLKILDKMAGTNSITLYVENAYLGSPYMYAANCFNPRNEFGDDNEFVYMAQPKIQPGQTVNITVGPLKPSITYRCQVMVALKGDGAYDMSRPSLKVDVTTTK